MSLISDERLTLEKSPLETSGFPATTTVTDRFSVENEQMTKNMMTNHIVMLYILISRMIHLSNHQAIAHQPLNSQILFFQASCSLH